MAHMYYNPYPLRILQTVRLDPSCNTTVHHRPHLRSISNKSLRSSRLQPDKHPSCIRRPNWSNCSTRSAKVAQESVSISTSWRMNFSKYTDLINASHDAIHSSTMSSRALLLCFLSETGRLQSHFTLKQWNGIRSSYKQIRKIYINWTEFRFLPILRRHLASKRQNSLFYHRQITVNCCNVKETNCLRFGLDNDKINWIIRHQGCSSKWKPMVNSASVCYWIIFVFLFFLAFESQKLCQSNNWPWTNSVWFDFFFFIIIEMNDEWKSFLFALLDEWKTAGGKWWNSFVKVIRNSRKSRRCSRNWSNVSI